MTEFTLTRFTDVFEALCNPALRQSLYDAGEVMMKDVLLTLHGEDHKTRRHLELRLFRRNFAHHYERHVFPHTVEQVIAPYIERGEADLVDFGYRVTMNLTADFAGIDRPDGTVEETEQLLKIVKTFSEGATLVHSDRKHADVINEVLEAKAEFSAQFLTPSWARRQQLIDAWRRGELDEDELPRDVLTVLLQNQDKVKLSDELIAREIAFYLQAGSHSTANSMVHAVHEIFDAIDEPAGLLDDPIFLQQCVHESMRLHPASPVAWRTPISPIALKNGVVADTRDLLILDLEAANRDPTIFGKDADGFNPSRTIFHPKTERYGLTFGTGVHMCTGRDLDGGVASRPDSNAESHQYGIVCMLIRTLLQLGMHRHPHASPEADLQTSRNNWAVYPIKFSPVKRSPV